ncbi:RNA polymerase sigma factor [Aquimarina sp. RZ0]|uniref:RNA polymerase sigma factor n=1 Tax=Aquimarina sp. RZ0 TaxID=2607730 RepID=UPI0011F2A1E4|nr:sigma-70 family RNA polymerase sigma factor [Aquimarina sp. RZ0]KAA1243648.1 sigma-70 family RNA polymerase sigma factor [Aquimarina sp. RZ0]
MFNEKKDRSVCKKENFELIFKAHSKVLRNYIYYKCGDINLAEDIVQESFIKLWENCKKVDYDNALFFLKSVAKNIFLNSVKHQKVVLHYKNTSKKNNTDIVSPDFVLEQQEFYQKVKKVIADLPEKEREVFLLNRIDKIKYREIAILLDISLKTVEKRMHNALVVIREKIGKI